MDTKRNGLKTVVASPSLTALLGNTSQHVFNPSSLVLEFPILHTRGSGREILSCNEFGVCNEPGIQPNALKGLAADFDGYEWNFVTEPGIQNLMSEWFGLVAKPKEYSHVIIVPLNQFNRIFKHHQPSYRAANPCEDYRVDKQFALNLLATAFGAAAEDDRFELIFDELSEDDGLGNLDDVIVEEEYQKMCALYQVLEPIFQQALPTNDVEAEVSLERLYDDEAHFRIRV